MKKNLKKIIEFVITFEARLALKRHNPKIIAVTGNVGKTSTKDAIFALVENNFKARASKKSMNSEIGLPLTILGLENAWGSFSGWIKNIKEGWRVARRRAPYPELLVLEIGADHPGDIKKIAKWLHPDIVVLTKMADIPVHLEFFKNTAEFTKEKMYLAQALKPSGVLVVNRDDTHFTSAVRNLNVKKIFFGTNNDASIKIINSDVIYDGSPINFPVGQKAIIKIGNREESVELFGVLGKHLIYSIAAACAVASILKIESSISKVFKNFQLPKGRMKLLKGINSSLIIDDSYNSSPLATTEALKTLGSLFIKGRKIAVLGDMKELGKESDKAHKEVRALAQELAHLLITVGKNADFADSISAAEYMKKIVRPGDVVLIKGSQSMRMEKISKALLAEPEKASELLVRQEKEWENR